MHKWILWKRGKGIEYTIDRFATWQQIADAVKVLEPNKVLLEKAQHITPTLFITFEK